MEKSFLTFPHIIESNNFPNDGLLIKTPEYCKKIFNHKCEAHYKKIFEKEGFHTCPYFFTTYVYKKGLIFSSLRTKKYGKGKRIKKGEFSPLLSNEHIQTIVHQSVDFFLKLDNISINQEHLTERINNAEKKTNEILEFINNTIHEIRKLNKNIKIQSHNLSKELSNLSIENKISLKKAKNVQASILAASSILSTRLDLYDLEINPKILEYAKKKKTSVYGKFKKAYESLIGLAFSKNLKIKLIGNSYVKIEAKDSFEMLPFLIFENAIKYSPEGAEIECNFEVKGKGLVIKIKNLGPRIESGDDLSVLFKKGFRGKIASNDYEGTGLGLYYAYIICKEHDIAISLEQSNLESNQSDLILFNVTIEFSDTICTDV
jgi:signal transduction histidine kinase